MNQKLKSEETKRLILECAFSLFHKNGYNPTSIVDIVKQAGLSKGAFYHHFKDKKEVGENTVEYILRNRIYNGMIAPLKENSNEAVVPLLLNLFSKRVNGFSIEELQLGCPLNNLINELGCTEESFRLKLKAIIEEWKNALVRLLEEGKKKREINKDVNSLFTANYLISAFEGARGIGKLYDDDSFLQEYLSGVMYHIKQLE